MTAFRVVLAWVAAALIAGCATVPPGADYPREHTIALPQPEQTVLGKAFADRIREHADLSGFRLLPAGTDGFVLRAEMAAQAQRTLDVQYFIFHMDVTGKLLLDELLKSADRGVRVRLLIDDLNLSGRDAQLTMAAAHPNVEMRVFNPASYRGGFLPARTVEFALGWTRLTYRMHNKLFLADNVIGIAGGRNVGDEYFSTSKDFEFGDFDVFAAGPTVKRLSRSFDAYWNSPLAIPVAALSTKATPEAFEAFRTALREHRIQKADEEYMRTVAAGDPLGRIVKGQDSLIWAPSQVLYDSPEKQKVEDGELDGRLLRQHLTQTIRDTRRELMMVSPYLVPGAEQMKLLADLRARNVGVRILTNSLESTDVPAVHAGYRKYRVPLLRLGVQLYEVRTDLGRPNVRGGKLKGTQTNQYALHAKVFVFDRSKVFIGSANFDHRSFRLNTEVGLMIDSPELAQLVAQRFEGIAQPANSYQVLLNAKSDGEPKLVWHTIEDGQTMDLTDEPGSSLFRALAVELWSLLPIEEQL